MSLLTRDFNLQASWRDLKIALGEIVFPPIFIPHEAVPDFMPHVYKRLIKSNHSFNIRAAKVQTRISNFVSAPDHPFLHFLRECPDDARKILRESQGNICKMQFDGMDSRDRLIAGIVVHETLAMNGLEDADYPLFSKFITTCRPDQAFEDREAKILENGAAAIQEMIESSGILPQVRPLDAVTRDNAKAQYILRLNFMQSMADCLAHAFGIPPVAVYFDQFPRQLHHVGGYAMNRSFMSEVGGSPIILIRASRRTFDSIPTMINFIGHEMRHQSDFRTHELFEQCLIGKDHPLFEHAALLHLNNQVSFRLPDSTTPAHLRAERNRIAVTQYLERGAYDFGIKLEKKLTPLLPKSGIDIRQELKNMINFTIT